MSAAAVEGGRPVTLARRRATVPPALIAGGVTVGLLILVALLAPVLAPADPAAGSLDERLLGPGSPGHLLGTDGQGRDLLSRLIWGARPSLVTGILPVLVSGLLGIALGMIAALGSPRVETIVMRVLDVFLAFPSVLLAIAITASLGPSVTSLVIALSVILVPAVTRVVNTEVKRLRALDFMDVARVSGAGAFAIAWRQVLPVIRPVVTVYCASLVGISVIIAAGLSFLGLGVAPPDAEWGSILNELRQSLFTDPVLALLPAGAIFLASAAFNVLGDGLRAYFEVRTEPGR